MSTLRCTNLQDTSGGNSLTTAQIYNGACKAWVQWGAASGTPSIRTSFNISSLTDEGVGIFKANFTTAFSDTNYVGAGKLLMCPGYFTHTHRGNPPLNEDKYILTGWVEYD